MKSSKAGPKVEINETEGPKTKGQKSNSEHEAELRGILGRDQHDVAGDEQL